MKRIGARPAAPLLVAAVLLWSGGGRAAVPAPPDPVSVSAAVDRPVIHIGDLVTLTITVSHDPGVEVRPPSVGASLGKFEIRDRVESPPTREGGRLIEKYDYIMTSFETGELSVPPVEVGFRKADGEDYTVLETGSVPVTVESVLSDEGGDIREIKPPREIPLSLLAVLIPAGIGLAVVLAAGSLWHYMRRRRRRAREKPDPGPRIPPYVTALAALRELRASNWLEKGRVKAYHTRLSEIVRRYVEDRFSVPAMESTTGELDTALRPLGIFPEIHALTVRLLERSDLVKFAKYRPPEEESRESLEWAFEIVEATRPLPPPPLPVETAGEKGRAKEAADGDGPAGGREK